MSDQIRMMLALDGAGAPLVTQCLGAMPGVVMLSRIHPAAQDGPNPLEQAYRWFNLIDDADIERLKKQPDWPYHEIMQMIVERAERKNQILVIGDRSNDDFVAADQPQHIARLFIQHVWIAGGKS